MSRLPVVIWQGMFSCAFENHLAAKCAQLIFSPFFLAYCLQTSRYLPVYKSCWDVYPPVLGQSVGK